MSEFDPDNLRLTDFLDLATLQEIQDSFAAVANVKATITDAAGERLTQPTPDDGLPPPPAGDCDGGGESPGSGRRAAEIGR